MNYSEKLAQLEKARKDIEKNIEEIMTLQLQKRYGKMTLDEIGKIWDARDRDDRWEMIYLIPGFHDKLAEGADSMDCSVRQVEGDIVDHEWGRQELFDIVEIFKPYAKRNARK